MAAEPSPISPPQAGRAAAAALGALLLLAGCSGPGADQAGQSAEAFAAEVKKSPDQACKLLSETVREDLEKSEKKPCAEALPGLDLPDASALSQVDVYEKQARAVLGQDVVFLARFKEGWRVTAAGCKAQGEGRPYDCELGG